MRRGMVARPPRPPQGEASAIGAGEFLHCAPRPRSAAGTRHSDEVRTMSAKPTIIYTHTDEAPMLATY